MVSMLFHGISVELYGIQVEWNSMERHGRYVISMEFQSDRSHKLTDRTSLVCSVGQVKLPHSTALT